MAPEDDYLDQEARASRRRRVKLLLRYLPRRTNMHRYPFLKFFANSARKRPYLWSFNRKSVIPALYAGFILTFMPLYGVQIPLALGLAIIFRANLMILVGLQLISNPFTIVPIYLLDFWIGKHILDFFGFEMKSLAESYATETGIALGRQGLRASKAVVSMMLGGAIFGYAVGFISVLAYRFLLRHSFYERKRAKRKQVNSK